MKNTTVSLTLKIQGNAGQQLKRMADDQIRSTQKINQNWTQIGTAQARFVSTAKAGTQATLSTAKASEKNLQTNRMLEGVLRQQSIQTRLQAQAIKQQQSSAAQMLATMQRMEQSARQTRQHVNKTHQDLKSSSGLWQKGTAVAGGTVAGGMVISNAMQKPRDYDRQLTYITATATGGQGLSTAERLKRMETLDGYIKQAVRGGGGTREDAAEAANALIASGKYNLETVSPALNAAVKTAFSTDALAKDAATLTVRMQDFGLNDLQKGHDIAVRGAQLGSFEYKDQAKWLAQQMAAANTIGYSGEKGFVELVAMNQVAMSTAGTTDEGGNNLVNLFAKLSSRDFGETAAKAVEDTRGLPTKVVKNKKGKVIGEQFDWGTYSMQQREQGVYSVDAFIKLLERQLQNNSQYQNLQKKIANTKDDTERKTVLEDMSNIAEGTELGKLLADRQALMAALAVFYKKDDLEKIKSDLPNAGGTVAEEYNMVSQREWAIKQAAEQEKLFAQSKAYDAVSGALSGLNEMVVGAAREHETLAGAAYGATVALTALAGGAALATVVGGKGGGGKVTSAAKKAGGAVATAASRHPVVAGTVAAGAVGYTVGSVISKGIEGTSLNDKIGELATKVWAALGNETAQAALEANAKYEQMIAQLERQNNLSSELIGAVRESKPVINLTQSISPVTSLLRTPASNANRQAAPAPTYLLRPKK